MCESICGVIYVELSLEEKNTEMNEKNYKYIIVITYEIAKKKT